MKAMLIRAITDQKTGEKLNPGSVYPVIRQSDKEVILEVPVPEVGKDKDYPNEFYMYRDDVILLEDNEGAPILDTTPMFVLVPKYLVGHVTRIIKDLGTTIQYED